MLVALQFLPHALSWALGAWMLRSQRAVLLHWREEVRVHDVVARMGGEEFVVLLPLAGVGHACALGLRLCDGLSVTVSVGVAAVGPADADVDQVLRRADHAMYRAKSERRNQVQQAPDA